MRAGVLRAAAVVLDARLLAAVGGRAALVAAVAALLVWLAGRLLGALDLPAERRWSSRWRCSLLLGWALVLGRRGWSPGRSQRP